MAHRWHTLAVGVDGPSTEVRLFAAGWNDTTKGRVLFDAAAAKSVMAAYRKHAIGVTIDLEHLSLDSDAPNFDPDARGTGSLELRDGELWLTGIRWTADAEQRLTERRQRFVSPAFVCDPKTLRVMRVHNVAICAQPATHNAMPLIAAGANAMDPEQIKAALDAIEAGDSAKALEILKALIASAAGASEPAEEAAPELNDAPVEEEMLADDESKPDDEMIAAAARALTGKSKRGEVLATLRGLKVSANAVTTLSQTVAELKRSQLQTELRELVRANSDKVSGPKLEKLVMSSRTIGEARALVDALPVTVHRSVSQPDRPAPRETEIRLTDEDRAVARLTGADPAKVLEFKKKAAQR